MGTGSFLLTAMDGLGDDQTRRLAVGTVLLERHPSLVLAIAAVQITGAAVDGVVGGAFVAFSLTSIGIAVVVARARTVWLCVAVLEAGYLAGLVAGGHTVSELSDEGQLGGVIGATAGYVVPAALFLGLRRRFTRFLEGVDDTLAAIRTDDDAFTPGLAQLLHIKHAKAKTGARTLPELAGLVFRPDWEDSGDAAD